MSSCVGVELAFVSVCQQDTWLWISILDLFVERLLHGAFGARRNFVSLLGVLICHLCFNWWSGLRAAHFLLVVARVRRNCLFCCSESPEVTFACSARPFIFCVLSVVSLLSPQTFSRLPITCFDRFALSFLDSHALAVSVTRTSDLFVLQVCSTRQWTHAPTRPQRNHPRKQSNEHSHTHSHTHKHKHTRKQTHRHNHSLLLSELPPSPLPLSLPL